MYKSANAWLMLWSILVVFPAHVLSQEDPCKDAEEKEERVNTGVVASVGEYAGVTAVQGDTGGAAPGEESPMITGSIKQVMDKKCAAVVVNNSPCNTYNVSFAVKGMKRNSSQSKTITTSSAKLAPKSSKEVSFACDNSQNNYAVDVLSAR